MYVSLSLSHAFPLASNCKFIVDQHLFFFLLPPLIANRYHVALHSTLPFVARPRRRVANSPIIHICSRIISHRETAKYPRAASSARQIRRVISVTRKKRVCPTINSIYPSRIRRDIHRLLFRRYLSRNHLAKGGKKEMQPRARKHDAASTVRSRIPFACPVFIARTTRDARVGSIGRHTCEMRASLDIVITEISLCDYLLRRVGCRSRENISWIPFIYDLFLLYKLTRMELERKEEKRY